MKIIHIIPNLKKGGAERIVIDLVRGLSRLKTVEVKLILFENQIEYGVDDLSEIIEIVPSKIHLSLTKRNRFQTERLQDVLNSFSPDIIHTHLFEAELVSRSCFFPTAKWFTHCHDRMQSFESISVFKIRTKRQFTNYFEKKYLVKQYQKNGGNSFIAISEDIEAYFKKVLPKRLQNIHLLYNCIDVLRFKSSEKRNGLHLDREVRLISVGRLDENKNQAFLVDVVQELENRNIPILLSIIGEGVERQNIQNKIDSLQLNSKINLLGLIENVETYLENADIYVHAALSEGFGLTLIEAMASGLPVVTLDGGGNRMLISEGENGFILAERSVKLFADKIQKSIETNENYLKMVHNALSFAQKFDITKYLQELIEIYKKSK